MNILSIDLEDYFMVTALEQVVRREDWDTYESRIEHNTYRLLEILDSHSCQGFPENMDTDAKRNSSPVRATFFCLGWVAERFPHLIREIHSRGHEIASHGYDHRMISSMSPDTFRADIRKSKAILEDLTGEKVWGYRAPSYSITHKTLWALRILAEEEFIYDSSIFPVYHDLYGMPDAPRSPFIISTNGKESVQFTPLDIDFKNTVFPSSGSLHTRAFDSEPSGSGQLLEFPLCTIMFLGQNFPVSGGGYFRLLPLRITLWALNSINERDNAPFVFYLHPWEIDPHQPRIKGLGFKSRFRHYLNLKKTENRLKHLLWVVPFGSFRNYIGQYLLPGISSNGRR